ncbi:hypothetical protein ccbrp13_06820 [Ktedonobacteria bacterium brp13]|nr:hypothetical protein ccbrp13_06820 [Ktedonobacteria bacterium brp13]
MSGMSDEQISERYKGITIWVEKVADNQYDGIFRWNGRTIKTDPAYTYAFSPPQAIEEAKGVIDTLLELRREGIFVADEDTTAGDQS